MTTRSSSFPIVFVDGRGMEGKGVTTYPVISPGVLDDDKGAGWRIFATLVSTHGVVDRGRHETTRRSLSSLFAPHLGGLCLQQHY